MIKRTEILTILFVVLSLWTGNLQAGRTIYVDDDGPADFNNIQAAIDDANDGDIIEVQPGIYTGTGNRDIDFNDKAITVRCLDPNDPDIVAATIIDCNGTESEPHRGFYFHNEEAGNSILAGFTIINGYASSGGAIFCEGSKPTITNCNITGNTAFLSGGGICYRLPPQPPPPPPPGQDCNSTGPTITNCIISGNSSDSGGGIYYADGGPIIVNCTITDNTANYSGGGIYSEGELPLPPPPPPPPGSTGEQSSTEILSDCNSNVPTIAHCIITNNTANYGGGIFNGLKGQQIITHCIVSGNIAGTDGGGMYNFNNWPNVDNCIISCNRADNIAGGILNLNAEATITNCTIVDNSSGAIFNAHGSDPVLVNNCILWGNEYEIALLQNYFPVITDVSKALVSHCDVQGGQLSVIVGSGSTLDWGQGNIDENPMFIRDPNDGGDGWGVGDNDDFGDLHLQAGSPCINAGDANFLGGGQTDIDGQLRVMGLRLDMGADEFFMPTLELIRPKGAEVWVSDSSHEIRWNSSLYEGMVNILFSSDAGNNWEAIESNVPDTGSYFWHLSDTVDSNQCIVSIIPVIPDPNVLCIESGFFTIHLDFPGPPVVSKWMSMGANFRRTGLSEDYGPQIGCVQWQLDTNGPVSASVTVGANGTVHIASEDGKVYTTDANGVLLWCYDANSPLLSSPTIGPDGTIYVGSQSGTLYAINLAGNLRWTHSTGGPIYSSPAVSDDGEIYVCSQDGTFYTLGPDGSELWSFELGGPLLLSFTAFSSPAIATDGTVYIAGLYGPALYAFEPNEGSVKWTCDFEIPIDPCDSNSELEGGLPFTTPVIGTDGTIYLTLLYDLSLYAIEPNEGAIVFSTDLVDPCSGWFDPEYTQKYGEANSCSGPALGPDGTIYVSLHDPYLRAIDPNGNINWAVPFGSAAGFTLAVGKDGLVYAASNDGNLYVVDSNGYEISRFHTDYSLSFPVIAADSTIIVSGVNDNAALTGDANSTIWAIKGDGCEDLDGDGFVNFFDVALLTADWLNCTDPDYPCNYSGNQLYLLVDIDQDQYVYFSDLVLIADLWLEHIIWLKPPFPLQASNPNPKHGATGVDFNADLIWTAGSGATSHDVYFGTNSPPPFIANLTSTTFDPGTMASSTTYYWRIDEANKWDTTTGQIWFFSTMSTPPPPPP